MAGYLTFACDVGWDSAGVLDLDLVEEISNIYGRADALALALDGAGSRAELACARDLADDLARIYARLHGQVDAAMTAAAARPMLTPPEASARAVDGSLAGATDTATDLVRELVNAVGLADAGGQRRTRRVVPSATGLLAAAVRLLPAADRGRYAAEYLSELWDLAQFGAGRLGQLRYAFCQLVRALPMRLALRGARRRSAAP